MIQPISKYETSPAVDREFVEKAIAHVLAKIDQYLAVFTDKFPDSSSINQVYQSIDNVEWTASFWTGMLWLAYEYTEKGPKSRLRVLMKGSNSGLRLTTMTLVICTPYPASALLN